MTRNLYIHINCETEEKILEKKQKEIETKKKREKALGIQGNFLFMTLSSLLMTFVKRTKNLLTAIRLFVVIVNHNALYH